jgi:flagellar hook assembly protein FlgD
VLALGLVTDGEYRELFLTAEDYDGVVFAGSDCVWIKHKVKDTPPPVIEIASFDGDFSAIRLSLAETEAASVVLHDGQGRRVKTLVNGVLPAGEHTYRWDGRDEVGNRVASGVYFCHIQAGAVNETGKIVMMK